MSRTTIPSHRFRASRYCTVAAVLLFAAALPAADEVPVPATADHLEGDFNTDQYHLWGNVDISVPGLARLQCDDFVGLLPPSGTAATNAVMTARGNVRLQMTGRAKGANPPIQILTFSEQAVYTGTNETFTLTGNPRVVSAYGTLSGKVIRYNLAANTASAEEPRFVPNSTLLTNLLDRARQKAPGRAGSN